MLYSQFLKFYFVLRKKPQKRAWITIVLRHALEYCSIRIQCLRKHQILSSECKKRANKRIKRIHVHMPRSHMILTPLHSLQFRKLKYQCIFVELDVHYLHIHGSSIISLLDQQTEEPYWWPISYDLYASYVTPQASLFHKITASWPGAWEGGHL